MQKKKIGVKTEQQQREGNVKNSGKTHRISVQK